MTELVRRSVRPSTIWVCGAERWLWGGVIGCRAQSAVLRGFVASGVQQVDQTAAPGAHERLVAGQVVHFMGVFRQIEEILRAAQPEPHVFELSVCQAVVPLRRAADLAVEDPI